MSERRQRCLFEYVSPSEFLFTSKTKDFDFKYSRRDFVNSSSRAISSATLFVWTACGEIENK